MFPYEPPTLTRLQNSVLAREVRASMRSTIFKQKSMIKNARRHVAVGTQTRKEHEVLTR